MLCPSIQPLPLLSPSSLNSSELSLGAIWSKKKTKQEKPLQVTLGQCELLSAHKRETVVGKEE